MEIFWALSLEISSSWLATTWFEWGQAKSAPLGVLVLLLVAVLRAWSVLTAAGRDDTEMAVLKSKRVMDVNCILRCWGGIELLEEVRDRLCVQSQVTHLTVVARRND